MTKTIKTIAMLVLILGSTKAIAQNAAINSSGSAPDASAMLDVSSTTKGLLTPRMTAAQRAAIASPATGLLVYQTDGTDGFYFYDGSTWTALSSGGSSYPTVVNAQTAIPSTAFNKLAFSTIASVTIPTTGKYQLSVYTQGPLDAYQYTIKVTQGGVTLMAGTSYYGELILDLTLSHVLNLSSTTDLHIEAYIEGGQGGTSPNSISGNYSLVKLAD